MLVKNLPSAGGWCTFVSKSIYLYSYHTTDVKLPLTLITTFQFDFLSMKILPYLWFHLTVPQLFTFLVCKSNKSGEKKKLTVHAQFASNLFHLPS
jgi:hypothetical protein